MQKWNERQRLALTIGVIVLLTGGLVALVVMDRQEIETQEEEITLLDDRIRTADVEIRKIKDREDKVLVFRAVEDRELAVLPTRQKIADFHSNLSLFLTSAGVRFRELPESSAVESELAKGIYVTRTSVSCESDAASLLKLINMLENDPRLVAVKGVRVVAGDREPNLPDAPVMHEAELTLETYFYNPESGAVRSLVPIPAAERRLEEADLKEAIASFQPERPDTYVLRPSVSRRDPFVDPRRALVKEDPEAVARAMAEQEPLVVDLENRLRDASEKDEQARALAEIGDLFRKEKLEIEIEMALNELVARLAQVQQMKTITIPALAARADAVKTRLEGLRGRRPPREMIVTASIAQTTLEDVRAAFERGDLTEVANLCNQWQTFLRGRNVDPEAASTVEEIQRFRHKAKAIAEFHGKGVRVTGTIVEESDPRRSVALVNGGVKRQGEKVDEAGEISVHKILRDGVDFQFAGEIIRVDRSSGNPDDKRAGRGKPAPAGGVPATHVGGSLSGKRP